MSPRPCQHATAFMCAICDAKQCWECHAPAPNCEVIKTIGAACDECKRTDPEVRRDWGPPESETRSRLEPTPMNE